MRAVAITCFFLSGASGLVFSLHRFSLKKDILIPIIPELSIFPILLFCYVPDEVLTTAYGNARKQTGPSLIYFRAVSLTGTPVNVP